MKLYDANKFPAVLSEVTLPAVHRAVQSTREGVPKRYHKYVMFRTLHMETRSSTCPACHLLSSIFKILFPLIILGNDGGVLPSFSYFYSLRSSQEAGQVHGARSFPTQG